MNINEVEKARRLVQLREATAKFYSVADCKQALEKNDWDIERAKLALQPADVSAILADGYLLNSQWFPIVDVNCEPGLKVSDHTIKLNRDKTIHDMYTSLMQWITEKGDMIWSNDPTQKETLHLTCRLNGGK